MTAYDQAVRAFRVDYLVRAVLAADGNICAAMRATGVHRNTISRILVAGGYGSRRVKHLIERHRSIRAGKSVRSVDTTGAVRRSA